MRVASRCVRRVLRGPASENGESLDCNSQTETLQYDALRIFSTGWNEGLAEPEECRFGVPISSVVNHLESVGSKS